MISTIQDISKSILDGTIENSNSFGNLSNPLIKSFLVLVPLSIGGSLLTINAIEWFSKSQFIVTNEIPNSISDDILGYLTLLLTSILLSQKTDFRLDFRIKFSIWLFLIFTVIIVIIFSLNQNIVAFFSSLDYPIWIGFLGRYVDYFDILVLGYFIASINGIRSISSNEAIYLSRFLYFKKFSLVYITAIIVFYLTKKSFPEYIISSFNHSKANYYILRRRKGLFLSFLESFKLFLQNFLKKMDSIAGLTESLLVERGYFAIKLRNKYIIKTNNEDIFALSFIFTFSIVLLMLIFN